MTFDELTDIIGWSGPWDDDGSRSRGWTTGTCRHVSDITAAVELPSLDDVVGVHRHATTPEGDWDGNSVVILALTGGRWMTWESWWGPTGSGFSEDAYGGDADVWIADNIPDAIRLGLTDDGRRMLGVDL